MYRAPVDPKTHGAIDYGFLAWQLLGPKLFGLKGRAKAISYFFGAFQGTVNALTDQPLAVKKLIPFRVHGQLETPFVPSLVLVPWLAGALRDRNARAFFFSFFGIAFTHYVLTDYNANERGHDATQPNPVLPVQVEEPVRV